MIAVERVSIATLQNDVFRTNTDEIIEVDGFIAVGLDLSSC